MKLKTTFKFYNDDDAPYFGAYKTGSLTSGVPTLMFCMDAIMSVVKDEMDKAEAFKDILLSTLTHEFCHAMQEWLGKEFNELEVERILGAYNDKWNVFNATPDENEQQAVFNIGDLLKRFDDMNETDGRTDEYSAGYYDFKKQVQQLFAPHLLWHEAEKENNELKKQI